MIKEIEEYYAHKVGEQFHPLGVHLREVARRAKEFGACAGVEAQCFWAGLLHDLGKYTDGFQARVRGTPRRAEHSSLGAAVAADWRAIDLAFAIAGHHAGLTAKSASQANSWSGHGLKDRIDTAREGLVDILARARSDISELTTTTPNNLALPHGIDPLSLEMRVRMVFSCLIDADRLDTEQFAQPEVAALRREVSLEPQKRLDRVLAHIANLYINAQHSAVNTRRRDVLQDCLRAAAEPPGIFSLTAPTGGGKTLASMAFALAHAAAHDKRRVVVVLPYLSIIEQNAEVFRQVLGADVVLEHHSDVRYEDEESPDQETVAKRLAVENWDAPVVVTTSVRFFETLFSNRPSDCRRLHRVSRSVVLLDEVQTLPPKLLAPILSVTQTLSDEYGVTFLLATATQPAWERRIDTDATSSRDPRWPVGTIREIATAPSALFHAMKRTRLEWKGYTQDQLRLEPQPWTHIADEIACEHQVLCIVNTREQAARLYRRLSARLVGAGKPHDHLFHLSARMCPQHRLDILNQQIRARLKEGSACVAVSTQLVEAGVDIDFPVVYRALGPLDSIAQAAGRCNREGHLPIGRVVVFETEDQTAPSGVYRRASDITRTMLAAHQGQLNIDDPGIFREYFNRLYATGDLDARRIQELRRQLDFPAVAEKSKMIDDVQESVLVPYEDGRHVIAAARVPGGINSRWMRKIQRYTVGLYESDAKAARAMGAVAPLGDSGVMVCLEDFYDSRLGLILEPPTAEKLIC